MALHSFEIFADYFQFYLLGAGVDRDFCLDFTDEDCRRMIMIAPSMVVIQPARNMTVPVDLELCEADPGYDAAAWDHVAECSLELPTGDLQVQECGGGEAVFGLHVAPGWYHLRALFSGLSRLSADGLDGDDRYRLVLWPGQPQALRIIKRWER